MKKTLFFIFIILMTILVLFTKNNIGNDKLMVNEFLEEVYTVNSGGRYEQYLETLDMDVEGAALQEKQKEIYTKNIKNYSEEQVIDVYWANYPMDLDIHFMEQNCFLEIENIAMEKAGDELLWEADVIVKDKNGAKMETYKQLGRVRIGDNGKLENIFFDNFVDLFNYGK